MKRISTPEQPLSSAADDMQGAASAADLATRTSPDRGNAATPRATAAVRVCLLAQGGETWKHLSRMLAQHPEIELLPIAEQDDLQARIAQQAPAALLLDASVSQPRALQALRTLRKIKEAALLPILLLCQKVDADFRTTVFSDSGLI